MSTLRRHSSLTKELPREVRAEVDRLLLEPGVTYDDIKEFLDRKGFDISRSAIGRYGKDFMGAYQRLRIIEDQSRALVSEAGGDGLILEEAASKLAAQQIVAALVDGSLDITSKAKLLDAFAKLQASSTAREKLKSDLADKAAKAAEKVERIIKKGGLTDDTVQAIRKEILGIAR